MNYRHLYQAGQFADIHKHLIFLHLLSYLQIKETPICIIDTHAGIGLYDLTCERAQKTKEYETGISKILTITSAPKLVLDFIHLVQNIELNHLSQLHYYPGSPWIASSQCREQDRLVLSELHPEDYQQLKELYAHQAFVQVHHMDGYQALHAFVPPEEKRGLVLIDPSYEQINEYQSIEQALIKALKKWPTGIYALWYPIKRNQSLPRSFIQALTPYCKTLVKNEFYLHPAESPIGLNGSGMLIINPPWNFEATFKETKEWLERTLR